MSSKRRIRRHVCRRKKAFDTEQEALRVARGQAHFEGRRLAVYRCPFSGGQGGGARHWHIGHADIEMQYPHGGKYSAA